MSSANKILVPIDFSPQSLIALEQASHLAKVFDAEITILNVVEEEGSIFSFFSDKQVDDVKAKLKAKLEELAKSTTDQEEVPVEVMIAHGKVYDKVVEVAEMLNAAFIVMGTSGTENASISKRFIGSNALRVVRESSIPVITIKGKHHRRGCQNIILPLDLTKETKEKVNKSIEFAKKFGSTVRVVSVLLTNDEFIVNRLTRQLDQARKFIEKEGVECTAEIIKASSGKESLSGVILDYAGKSKGDIIMIMTQQEEDFIEFFIGSSAQEIINHSDIPVMSIIPSRKKDTTVFTPY